MITERVPETKHGSWGRTACVDGVWWLDTRKALHACERCRYVRLVTLTPYARDGVEVGGRVGSPVCTACHYEQRADHYQTLVDENRKRAAIARSKQVMRRLKPYKTKA